ILTGVLFLVLLPDRTSVLCSSSEDANAGICSGEVVSTTEPVSVWDKYLWIWNRIEGSSVSKSSKVGFLYFNLMGHSAITSVFPSSMAPSISVRYMCASGDRWMMLYSDRLSRNSLSGYISSKRFLT